MSYLDIPDHENINVASGNPGWKEKTIEIWFKARNLPNSDPLGEGFAADVPDSQIIYEQGWGHPWLERLSARYAGR